MISTDDLSQREVTWSSTMRVRAGAKPDQVRHAAVEWVAGMTDRYAARAAREWIDFDADRLPFGLIG